MSGVARATGARTSTWTTCASAWTRPPTWPTRHTGGARRHGRVSAARGRGTPDRQAGEQAGRLPAGGGLPQAPPAQGLSAQDNKQGDGEPLPAADPFAAETNPRGDPIGRQGQGQVG